MSQNLNYRIVYKIFKNLLDLLVQLDIQELVNKRPTSSSTPYMLDVNGSINCSTNFSCSGSSSTRSLTSSSGNLTLNNGRIYASNS